jgi:long-chain acyl-CoA synthetase
VSLAPVLTDGPQPPPQRKAALGGRVRITDRKRNFIKNSGGEMISPAHVEGALTPMPEIAKAMVFGDRRPYLVAVIVPDPDFAASRAKRAQPLELAAPARDRDFHKMLGYDKTTASINLTDLCWMRSWITDRDF